MKTRVRLAAAGAAVPALALLLTALPAQAVVTSTWNVETYTQFDAGDATDAFITSLGEVRPGWTTDRSKSLEGDGVWSALRTSGGKILVGSDDGAIYRFDGKDPVKVVAIPGVLAVVAMVESGGALYAAGMPSDTIWKIDVTGKRATAFAKLEDKSAKKGDEKVETIWALAAGKDGTLYAGSGPDGKLWAIDKSGKARVVFATTDKRVTAVTVTSDGAVWFGTSERALVFRHAGGDTRAMADFAGNEIAAIAEGTGAVIVAANELVDTTPAPTKTATDLEAIDKPTALKGHAAKAPALGSKPGADKEPPAGERKGARKGKGALFRVELDGKLEQLHALTSTYFTSIAVDPAGAVYAGAADKGRIYMVEPDDSVATAFDVDERAVAQVFWDGKQLAFTTDDAAALYRVTGKASDAKYVSDVFDAKNPSRWGRLLWQGSGRLVVETRTGNTAKPDVGWSTWQAPTRISTIGGGQAGGTMASPPGRYVQFRVSLPDGATLRRVTSYYLPANLATSVEEVTVEPAATEKQPTLKEAGGKTRSPVLRVKWKIENPDSDDTSYALQVRRDGDVDWRTLQTGKPPLTAVQFDWNTETFADGWYRVRVTSSDALANSPDRALTAQKTSALFLVDNTRPLIEGLTVRGGRADARLTDELSVISEIAFSIDDGPWQLGATTDGIFDSEAETLRLDIPAGLGKGTHTLSLRVADAAGNVGSATATFVVR